MRDFGIASKSSLADGVLCPYHLGRIKVDKIKSHSNVYAGIGASVHQPVAAIRRGTITLDTYLLDPKFHLVGEFDIQDREDICDMVKRAFTSDPIVMTETEKQRVQIERYLAIDEKGRLTKGEPEPYHEGALVDTTIKNKAKAIYHGVVDRILLRDDGSVMIDDLKTGHQPVDNPLERYGYVLLGKALYPKAMLITFAYHYLRTGRYVEWRYEWKN